MAGEGQKHSIFKPGYHSVISEPRPKFIGRLFFLWISTSSSVTHIFLSVVGLDFLKENGGANSTMEGGRGGGILHDGGFDHGDGVSVSSCFLVVLATRSAWSEEGRGQFVVGVTGRRKR